MFSVEKTLMLLEQIKLSEHTIKLEDDKQLFHRPIYSLGVVKLETLKTYIESHLKTGFIWSSKSLVGTLILFNKKLDNSFCLYIDYPGLNKLFIKN